MYKHQLKLIKSTKIVFTDKQVERNDTHETDEKKVKHIVESMIRIEAHLVVLKLTESHRESPN